MSTIINFAKPIINIDDVKKFVKIYQSGQLAHGKYNTKFEEKFSKLNKTKFAITVSSCTAGLMLAYKSLGLRKNDEIIVPALTHVATAHSALHLGLKIKFADVNNDGNIDPNEIKKLISKKTKAICVVHFIGIPCDMKKILEIAKKNKLKIIEDCAIALGSKINNKFVGTFGDFSSFSFYPSKHITTSEGGMILTKKKKFFNIAKKLKAFGYTKSFNERKIPGLYDINMDGYNFRMSEIAAALGLSQLKYFKRNNSIRQSNWDVYKNEADKIGLKYICSENQKRENISYFTFNIILRNKKLRNKILKDLALKKIFLSIHYPISINKSKFYKKNHSHYNCKKADYFANRIISLPIGPHINHSNIKYIVGQIKNYI